MMKMVMVMTSFQHICHRPW